METDTSEEENWIMESDGSMYQVSDSLRMLRESEFSPESSFSLHSNNSKFPINDCNTCTDDPQPSESNNSPVSSKSYTQFKTPSQTANLSSEFPKVPSILETNDCIAGNFETLKGRQCNNGEHFFLGPAIQSCQPVPLVPCNSRNLQHLPSCNGDPVVTDLAGKVPKLLDDRDNFRQMYQNQNIRHQGDGQENLAANINYSQSSCVVNPLRKDHVCQWQDINDSDGQLKTCAHEFATIFEIVEHISEAHVTVDTAEGDRHFCYWEGCDRKLHPFKARYKLINHIRLVHFQIIIFSLFITVADPGFPPGGVVNPPGGTQFCQNFPKTA